MNVKLLILEHFECNLPAEFEFRSNNDVCDVYYFNSYLGIKVSFGEQLNVRIFDRNINYFIDDIDFDVFFDYDACDDIVSWFRRIISKIEVSELVSKLFYKLPGYSFNFSGYFLTISSSVNSSVFFIRDLDHYTYQFNGGSTICFKCVDDAVDEIVRLI